MEKRIQYCAVKKNMNKPVMMRISKHKQTLDSSTILILLSDPCASEVDAFVSLGFSESRATLCSSVVSVLFCSVMATVLTEKAVLT